MMLAILLAALPVQEGGGSPPNVVVIVADDLGVDLVGCYGEGPAPPCTPNIDGLAAAGLLFRNAWANPTCSPSRAAILTGRHGFRTGVGVPIGFSEPGLPLSETIVAEFWPPSRATAVGKWHLEGDMGPLHPNASGFGHYAGARGGAVPSYFSWTKTVDGQDSPSTTYATTDAADEAILAALCMEEPWFLYVAFNAPHGPWHIPPPSTCPALPCPQSQCANLPPSPTVLQRGKAAVEAMDTEIGRLLEVIDEDDWVFFIGDNGSPWGLVEPPFTPEHAKDSLYEGGVNVPLIVKGPGVATGECAGLVGCTDLFATIAELVGSQSGAEDSVSMVPYFTNPGLSLRSTVYAETFAPNGLPPAAHRRAVRGARYKLIRQDGKPDEFYDLQADPFETANLRPNLTILQQGAYSALVAELVRLGVD